MLHRASFLAGLLMLAAGLYGADDAAKAKPPTGKKSTIAMEAK